MTGRIAQVVLVTAGPDGFLLGGSSMVETSLRMFARECSKVLEDQRGPFELNWTLMMGKWSVFRSRILPTSSPIAAAYSPFSCMAAIRTPTAATFFLSQ